MAVRVGGRVKARRTLIGMSQTELGKHVGVTFQQIQKYEKGIDRIAASRLWVISLVLGRPISWFFEGLDERKRITEDHWGKRETLQLTRYFLACSPDVQKRLLSLLNTIADDAK